MIEEALELLTGVSVGERGLDGTYPSDSVFGRAALRLEEMTQAVAEWSAGEEKPSGHIITEPMNAVIDARIGDFLHKIFYVRPTTRHTTSGMTSFQKRALSVYSAVRCRLCFPPSAFTSL